MLLRLMHYSNSYFLFSDVVLCGILMSACDVSAIAKPWDIQHKMAKLVADEFFDQGDLEKLQLNEQPVVSFSFYFFHVIQELN